MLKLNHFPVRLVYFILFFFFLLSLSGCSFSEKTEKKQETLHHYDNDITNTDFGSTILSLLTPENGTGTIKEEDIQEAFSYFCNQVFIREVSTDSISLHYTLSRPEKFHIDIEPSFGETLPDNGEEAVSAENYLYLLSLFPYDSLSEQQKLTYDIFKDSLEDSISLSGYELYAEPLSKTIGIQAQLPVLLSEYTFYREQDVEEYFLLLTHLPAYFELLSELEQEKSDAGMFMHEENAVAIIRQCDEILSLEKAKKKDNFLITSFQERLEKLSEYCTVSGEKKQEWMQKNKQVLKDAFYPAYRLLEKTFQELLKTGKNSGGLYYFPEGKEYYEHLIRHNTGSGRSIDEIKKLINDRIMACAKEISSVMEKEDVFDQAMEEADRYSLAFSDAKNALSYLRTQISDAFPMPSQVSLHVLSVPPSLSEYLSPAFYLVPPLDCETENCIYVNTPQIRDDLSFFTTLAHEGYPGHLYQNAMFYSTNPELLRCILSYPGYSEGWASYAELYSYRLSGLSEDAALLQEKNMLLTLCMYAMADIHIHYDGYTEDGLKDYLNGFGITNKQGIHEIYLQILAEPANYLKYTVGCLEFLALKEEMQDLLKENFDPITFHEAILATGPCSFPRLREQVMQMCTK